jgi:dienelactone hydrolase
MRKALVYVLATVFLAAPALAETTDNPMFRGKKQELHLYGTRGRPPVILSSGDLGWAGLVVHVAEFLANNGYYVVGLNSKAYLASFTTKSSALAPQDVPKDFLTLIEYTKQSSSVTPILAGVSEGAGLSVLAATDSRVKSAVAGILALGLPDENELGWKWQDFTIWITKKVPDEPSFMVSDLVGKVSPVPLAEIHSTHDEFLPLEKAKALFARAGEPKRMWVIEADNHRFSNSHDELDRRMLEALTWIKSRR